MGTQLFNQPNGYWTYTWKLVWLTFEIYGLSSSAWIEEYDDADTGCFVWVSFYWLLGCSSSLTKLELAGGGPKMDWPRQDYMANYNPLSPEHVLFQQGSSDLIDILADVSNPRKHPSWPQYNVSISLQRDNFPFLGYVESCPKLWLRWKYEPVLVWYWICSTLAWVLGLGSLTLKCRGLLTGFTDFGMHWYKSNV